MGAIRLVSEDSLSGFLTTAYGADSLQPNRGSRFLLPVGMNGITRALLALTVPELGHLISKGGSNQWLT